MNIIRDMLKDNLIMAGNFEKEDTGKYEFVPILLPVDRIIEFIEHEWASLGKTPNIGEVCWFRATASGENLAKELNLI
jgi:hypothetical protein